MRTTLKYTSLVVLAVLYLIAASGTLIAHLVMPPLSSDEVSMRSSTGTSKAPTKPVLTTRRYIPLVKEVSHSPVLLTCTQLRFHLDEVVVLGRAHCACTIHSFYFSSLSDRAPPIAS